MVSNQKTQCSFENRLSRVVRDFSETSIFIFVILIPPAFLALFWVIASFIPPSVEVQFN